MGGFAVLFSSFPRITHQYIIHEEGAEEISVSGTVYMIPDVDQTHTIRAAFKEAPPVPAGDFSGNMDNAYRVLFETSGGSFIQPATGLSSGDRITKPADPERDGYRFAGWYKDSACTIAWIFSEDAVPGDLSLYAKWTPAGSSVPPTTETAKPTAEGNSVSTAAPTATQTVSASAAPVGAAPTLTEAPAPVAGLLLGLLAADLLMRRRK